MSDHMWGAFVVIAIIAFSIAGSAAIIKYVEQKKECSTNSECNPHSYCGSDFKCNPYPNIQQTIINKDYSKPAVILALGIVVAALILRRRNNN